MLALIAGELGAEGLGPEAVVAAADATAAALEDPGDAARSPAADPCSPASAPPR